MRYSAYTPVWSVNSTVHNSAFAYFKLVDQAEIQFIINLCYVFGAAVFGIRKQQSKVILMKYEATTRSLQQFYISGQKIKDELSKFMDKMKPKRNKKKKIKNPSMFRMMANQADVSNEDDVSSREGSIHSQRDSDRVRLLQIHNMLQSRPQFLKHDRFTVAFWPNSIRTVIWRATWQARRTWWNSSCHVRCGALAAGLSASLMWVRNISDSAEYPGGSLSVCGVFVKACPWVAC